MVRQVLAYHAEQTKRAAEKTPPAPALGYASETLDVLFGEGVS